MGVLKNAKHEHFAQLRAQGVSASKAAITAGYSERRAEVTGSELTARPEVAVRIKELMAAVAERAVEKTALDRAWVLERLTRVVSMGMDTEPIVDSGGEQIGAKPANLPAANKALELLGKELGMFVDRKEVRTGALDELPHDAVKELRDALARRMDHDKVADQGSASRRLQ